MHEIEFIVHCWHEKYARYLAYQLSSIYLNAVEIPIRYTVVTCDEDDGATVPVVEWYARRLTNLVPNIHRQERTHFLSRAIGRNQRAQDAQGRLVWFCDSDYLFGPGCLQWLAQADLPVGERLFMPGRYWINRNRQLGAIAAAKVNLSALCIYDWNPADFVEIPLAKAIGGLQIVRRQTALLGYCPGDRRVQRRHGGPGLWSGGDPRFRRQHRSWGHPLPIPNLYRLREPESGGSGPYTPPTN
jgi:hypothetical protein